jgi:hypothetical protein
MATPVVFNGVTYSIPAYGDIGYAQGSGNLSSYLIALAGGPFPYTSQSPNPASTGTIRLAHLDTINWRNQANSGDLPLGVNASDQLTFNGTPLAASNINPGVAGHGAYYAANGTTLSDAGAAAVRFGDITISNAGYLQFVNTLGTQSVFLSASGTIASYVLQLPTLAGANFTSFINDGSGILTFSHVTQPSTTGLASTNTADIPPTTIVGANGVSNLYRVSIYIYTSFPDAGAGTVTAQILWTDPSTNSHSTNTGAINLAVAGDFKTLTQIISAKSGTNIQYSTTHTGSYATAQYNIYLSIEYLW